MKKLLALVLSVLVVVSLFVGCGKASETSNITSSTTESERKYDTSTEAKEEYSVSTESAEEDEQEIIADLEPINVFESVEVVCDGWNGFGKVTEISTSECSAFVQDNVVFSLETSYSELQNGDTVVVTAQYDENFFAQNGYEVIETSHEFEVDDLIRIIEGQDYHDGVAWVRTGNLEWSCCDKEGNILFVLDNNQVPMSYFANEVAIVGTLLGEITAVVDKAGNVVWSPEDGYEYGEARWGSDSVTSVKIIGLGEDEDYFGYTRVSISIDTFEQTGTYYGIIDSEGNWWSEPGVMPNIGYYEYCIYTSSKYRLYNILTNEEMEVPLYYDISVDYWAREYITERHNGLIYQVGDYCEYYIEHGVYYSDTKNGYYDIDGQLVIDLSKYNIPDVCIWDIQQFNDGYSLIDITNDQGSGYYVVIDTSGNEMFSPKRGVDHGELKCGYYWVKDVGYLNIYGEEAFDLVLKDGEDFSEGMAYVTTADSNHHYINTDGEIVF
ncbi:MAG: hypothetical protein LUH23_09635 [Oscillospiraceae bacterium]|nr:hypothetical protein [Oscillospiraceae bacterium]